MTRQEAFQILGINGTTNAEEIKKAYKTKAKKYHPDIYQGNKTFAEEKMKQINEAYTLLCQKPTSVNYSSYNSESYEAYRRRREEEKREFEEHLKRIREEAERMQKEIEETHKKIKKFFKRILIFLFCILEFHIIIMLKNAIESTFYYFNEEIWFLFGYFILCDIFAFAGVILAPIGFIWLLKRAGIIK